MIKVFLSDEKKGFKGFTLAELLIALAILGVIATFTIPKILDSGSSSQNNSIAKEVASMFSGAHQNIKLTNGLPVGTSIPDMTPYMNFVAIDSVTPINSHEGGGALNCSAGTNTCLKLHSGAIVGWENNTSTFASTELTEAVRFYVDPDGQNNSIASVVFFLYYNGKLRTYGTIDNGTYAGNPGLNPNPSRDPPWFSWGS